jgi:hypothetical protein
MPAIVRRLWLYGRISDLADVPGCARFANLCGYKRNHEVADRKELVTDKRYIAVMVGLVPAIHVLPPLEDVDARHKAGHDEGE